MGMPREQHGVRAGAYAVGSAHLDGRQPANEDGIQVAASAGSAPAGEDVQPALDAASSEPRSDADGSLDAAAGGDVHPAPTRQLPHPDNTDMRG